MSLQRPKMSRFLIFHRDFEGSPKSSGRYNVSRGRLWSLINRGCVGCLFGAASVNKKAKFQAQNLLAVRKWPRRRVFVKLRWSQLGKSAIEMMHVALASTDAQAALCWKSSLLIFSEFFAFFVRSFRLLRWFSLFFGILKRKAKETRFLRWKKS